MKQQSIENNISKFKAHAKFSGIGQVHTPQSSQTTKSRGESSLMTTTLSSPPLISSTMEISIVPPRVNSAEFVLNPPEQPSQEIPKKDS